MAKPKIGIKRFSNDCSNVAIEKTISNKTAINRSASMISLSCEYCGLSFLRKASEAKRNAKSYCGVACMGADRRREAPVECRICKKMFSVKLSSSGRVTCCSKECKARALSESRTEFNLLAWKGDIFSSLKGESSHFSKINEDQKSLIKLEDGTHKNIAKKYGISRSRVSRIKKNT